MTKNILPTPSPILFETKIPIQISHINYGNHVGNDTMVSLLNEARVRFLKNFHHSELNIEGSALMIKNLEVAYKKEVFYGDVLDVAIGIGDIEKARVDLLYVAHNHHAEVCRAKTTLVFIDPKTKKVVAPPSFFLQLKKRHDKE